MKVVVTIPAYNEEKTIGGVLKHLKEVMDKHKYNYTILVVNDGSQDKTEQVAKKAGATVVSHPRNYGLAEAFKTEMKTCLKLKADVIVHTDADGQYRANEIPLLINKLKEGHDLVLGSRFQGKIEYMPFMKKFGNRAFSRVISNISGKKISDAQTGFRAFTPEVAQLPITSNFTYTQEQIIRSVREKFRVVEVPVHFDMRGEKTKSRLMKGPFDYARKAWINLLRVYRDYEPLKFFGMTGGVLFILGLLLGAYFVYLHFTTGISGHLGLLFLMLILLFTGLQIILFGFLADMLKK